MDTTSAIVFLAVVLSVLLVIAYLPEIDRLMGKTFSHKSILRATDLRDILLAILGVTLAELGRALFVLNWAGSLLFALVAVVIIVFIMNLRHRSEYRQQWLNAQSMKAFESLIKSAVKEALKEDREETDNSKRNSQ